MNNLISHTRDIYVYLYRNRLVYAIPLYLEQEKAYFKSNYLEIDVHEEQKKSFVFSEMKPRALLTNFKEYRDIFSDLEGCCPRK